MANKPLTTEVVLARDLPVGPKGGIRKAGETVELPATEARLLLMVGDARRPDAPRHVYADEHVSNTENRDLGTPDLLVAGDNHGTQE